MGKTREGLAGALLGILWLLVASCGHEKRPPEGAPLSFESDLGLRTDGKSNSGSTIPTAGASGAASAVSEASVVALAGDRLFALSQRRGLSVVDVADPEQLRLLGSFDALPVQPLQLYPRGDTLWVLCSAWRAIEPGQSTAGSSHLLALDVSDPASIRQLTSLEIPGVIDDTRLAGDVLYVASNRLNGCPGCSLDTPTSVLTSFDLRDPAAAKQLAQLRFGHQPAQRTAQNHMLFTEQHIYLAGPQWSDTGSAPSTIHVVDIAKGDGSLSAGAQVQVAGAISSALQMDERQGVLRVVSQVQSQTPYALVLETFEIFTSGRIEARGRLELSLSDYQPVHGVGFTDTRAYVAADSGGTVYTLDLSDPAAPKQAGRVESDAVWTYFQTQGDRLFALGNRGGVNTLALYDVARTGAPTLLSQADFPPASAGHLGYVEPTHLPLEIPQSPGLLLIPYAAYDSGDQFACSGRSAGGVQLIGLEGERLSVLGRALSAGQPLRAVLHRDHVLAVSEQHVETFALTDSQAPRLSSRLTTQQDVTYVAQLDGGVIARVIQPDDNVAPLLELTMAEQAADPNARLSVLSLPDLLTTDPTVRCDLQFRVQSLHANGSRVYAVFEAFMRVRGETEVRVGVVGIDASDPSAPQPAGRVDWNTADWGELGSYSDTGSFQRPSYVWQGTTLLLLEQRYRDVPDQRRLRVVDMRDPADPSVQLVELAPDAYVNLLVAGDSVLVSRYHALSDTRVKFYVDRIDISDPRAPRLVSSVNTPGALLGFDPDTKHAVSYTWRSEPRTGGSCERTSTGGAAVSCVDQRQSLQLVELTEDGAHLLDGLELASGEVISSSARTQGVVLVALSSANGHAPLLAIPARAERLQRGPGELDVAPEGARGQPRVVAHGDHALVSIGTDVALLALKADGSTDLVRALSLRGPVQSVDMSDADALLALGFAGAQRVVFE